MGLMRAWKRKSCFCSGQRRHLNMSGSCTLRAKMVTFLPKQTARSLPRRRGTGAVLKQFTCVVCLTTTALPCAQFAAPTFCYCGFCMRLALFQRRAGQAQVNDGQVCGVILTWPMHLLVQHTHVSVAGCGRFLSANTHVHVRTFTRVCVV